MLHVPFWFLVFTTLVLCTEAMIYSLWVLLFSREQNGLFSHYNCLSSILVLTKLVIKTLAMIYSLWVLIFYQEPNGLFSHYYCLSCPSCLHNSYHIFFCKIGSLNFIIDILIIFINSNHHSVTHLLRNECNDFFWPTTQK